MEEEMFRELKDEFLLDDDEPEVPETEGEEEDEEEEKETPDAEV